MCMLTLVTIVAFSQKLGTITHLTPDYQRSALAGQRVGLIVLANGNYGGFDWLTKQYETKDALAADLTDRLVTALADNDVTALPVPLTREEARMVAQGYDPSRGAQGFFVDLLTERARELEVDHFVVVSWWSFSSEDGAYREAYDMYENDREAFEQRRIESKMGKEGIYANEDQRAFTTQNKIFLTLRGGVIDARGVPLYSGESSAVANPGALFRVKGLKSVISKSPKRFARIFTGNVRDGRLRWLGANKPK